MKSVFTSYYGEEKIRERNINYQDVPDLNKLSRGVHKVIKKIGKKEMVAFYRVGQQTIVLMTAYWRIK